MALATLGVAALFARGASAQSENVLGKDDAGFARALYRNGLADLAEGLCNTIEKKGNLTPEGKVGITALHLDLRFDLAQKEPDTIKRKDLLKAILTEKEELVRQYPGMKEGVEAAETLPDVYRALGEAITVAVQKTSDVAKVADLQREGEQVYAQAEEQLKAKIAELEPEHSSPANDRLYLSMRFNLPRTYYYHSLLYPAGEWKKKDLLEKAVEGFQQFGLDYMDNLLYYDGLIFEGLAQKDLGKNEDALTSFDDAIKLYEAFKDEKGKIDLSIDAANVISKAALQKVLLQTELKDYAGASATAKGFLEVVPEPGQTSGGIGLAVIAAQADAEIAAGDTKAAADTAAKLVAMDEKGRWGEKGRDIQAKLIGGGGGDIDSGAMLKIAAQRFSRGDEIAALRIAHQGIDSAKGTAKEASVSCEGYLLIGSIYANRGNGWNYEAALAFDTAYKNWPKADKAPEAAYQALSAYSRLYTDDKRPWFKKRADESAKILASDYASSPRAAYAQLQGAKQLADDGKFLEAAAEYQKVQPSAASYLEAQFRAGTCYFQQAKKLCGEKKEGEADQYVKQAESMLKKARTDLEAAVKSTMNLEEQARYEGSAFQASVFLAQLFLLDCVKKPADAIEALKGTDEKYASDEDKVAAVWNLRISAMEKMGKLDDAIGLLDSLAKKTPDSNAIGSAAGLVARALDRRAQELEKAGKTKERDEQWKKAATYYSMSGHALAKSKASRASTIEEVANRLFVLGLQFNEVPKEWDSFVGWPTAKTTDPTLFKEAENLYRAALQISPSYQNMIKLGRSLGFQGQFAEASAVYGRLFDSESVIDPASNPPKFNAGLLKEKPELYVAYLEWGVANEEAGVKARDNESFLRAEQIFDNLVRTPDPEGPRARVFWNAKLHQMRNLYNQGKYPAAQLLMRDVERTNTELGAPAGLQADFAKLKESLKGKAPQSQNIRSGAPSPAPAGGSGPSDPRSADPRPAQQKPSGDPPH